MYVCVFPGQGAQKVGMGKELWDRFSVAREMFSDIQEAFGDSLLRVMFEGPEEELNLTYWTQPALMAVSVVALHILQLEFGFSLEKVSFVAGHSLGEYTALCASGVISVQQTTQLLKKRGEAMERAPDGRMMSILGAPIEKIEEMLQEKPDHVGVCEIANHNMEGHIVVSGTVPGLAWIEERAKAFGVKRCVPLNVTKPAHCSLMKDAREIMKEALQDTPFFSPCIPIVTNVSAEPQMDVSVLKDHLIRQMTERVLWTETQNFFTHQKVNTMISIGFGNVLVNIAKRAIPSVEPLIACTPEELCVVGKRFGEHYQNHCCA